MSQESFGQEMEEWIKRGEDQALEKWRNVSIRDNWREVCWVLEQLEVLSSRKRRRTHSDEKSAIQEMPQRGSLAARFEAQEPTGMTLQREQNLG